MATGNAINANTAGQVRYNGTGTFTADTLTQNAVLIGGASDAIASTAVGSTGQVLQGNTSAAPTYSTATYPSVATGTGTILRANGTNWVASTSTYPDTNAVNTLLYASSSNVMGALATANNGVLITSNAGVPSLLAAGSTGQVLTATTGAPPSWASPATSGTVTNVSGTANQVAVATGTTTPVISLIGPYTPATYTAHGVLIGEGTSSIVPLAAGSAGQVLQSGGASADPAYSTATYPVTAGTSGNVLTSDGTNWTSSANSGAFAPNSIVNLWDDFTAAYSGIDGNATHLVSQLVWRGTTSLFFTPTTSSGANPGVVGNIATTTASQLVSGNPAQQIFLGSGAISINWVIKVATLSSASPRYTLYVGLGDLSTAESANGVYFAYSDNLNSGNWVGKTAAASSRSSANSAIAVVNNAFVNLGITINAAGTSASFFVNGTQIANSPLSSNLPTLGVTPLIVVASGGSSVAANSVVVDLFYMTITLTTPR